MKHYIIIFKQRGKKQALSSYLARDSESLSRISTKISIHRLLVTIRGVYSDHPINFGLNVLGQFKIASRVHVRFYIYVSLVFMSDQIKFDYIIR